MRHPLLPALAALAALCAVAPLAAQSTGAPRDTNVVLHPGDEVKVVVWRNAEMSGDFVVGINGALRHPLYQEVQVVGIPLYEVETRLREFLAKYVTNPQLVVEPLFRVTVGGEVRQPNLYPLPRETTISQAVALAGGATENGRLDRVKLIRGQQEYLMDLTSPTSRWDNEPVQSGDQILVQRRRNLFRDIIFPMFGIAGAVASIINVAKR
ncbi:MAG TPA: SLBB domain-containing protein [Gemmatimonadaceae bacterium]|nr:SLBB domain-containing protein [Gemmatimonadaceae bacterium]